LYGLERGINVALCRVHAHCAISADVFTLMARLHFPLRRYQTALDDMLIETAPRRFRQEEIEGSTTLGNDFTPIHLVNAAWRVAHDHTVQYHAWEEELITQLLSAAETSLRT
jgi:hypothetical protein